ncbi:MAG: hypothetical protein K8S99_01930 [Planctomycetes bacterium]|nr:hypothetical protein [Planctomycetota bacterium]
MSDPPPSAPVRERPFAVLLIAALAAACAAGVYLRSLSGDFVFDDVAVIRDAAYLHDMSNWPDVLTFHVMSQDVVDFNRPVQVASLMLDATIWGKNPLGYRLTNLLLHAVCTFLTVVLLARLLREGRTPAGRDAAVTPLGVAELAGLLLAGLLFALHPVMVEAAAVPSNRKDQLATLFVLLSMLAAIRFRAVMTPRNIVLVITCLFCTLLAVGAKENGAAGPPILLAYWWLFRRREKPVAWLSLIGACALIVAVFLAVRFGLERDKSEVFYTKPSALSPTLLGRANFEVGFVLLYARNLLWPTRLCADYNLWSLKPIIGLGVLRDIIFMAVGGAAILLAQRSRLFCLGLCVVVMAMLPAANLVPIYIPAADRYWYLPMVGLGVMVALGASWVGARAPRALAAAALAISLLLCAALGVLTWQRIGVWDNPKVLWTDTHAKNEGSIRALTGLATELANEGNLAQAIPYFEKAAGWVTNRPDYSINIVIGYDNLGRRADVDAAIRKMLAVYPRFLHPESIPRTGELKGVDMDRFESLMLRFREANPYYDPVRPSAIP